METRQLPALFVLVAGIATIPMAQADEAQGESVRTIKVDALSEYAEDHADVVILDVRTPEEYGLSHLPGAININVQDDAFDDAVSRLDNDKTYIVYCTKNPVGGRSMTALGKMKALGFKDLISLEGGHVAWTEAALPMSTESQR